MKELVVRRLSPPARTAGLLVILGLAALANPPAPPSTPPPTPPSATAQEGIQVPKPPFSEGIFPCSSCHDGKSMKVNLQRRELTGMHGDIILNHGPESRWCLDCHDPANRDRLRLASGERIGFDTSYQLCGQCHGDKFRDWRVGVHGKRTGSWNGAKQYLLCVHCHNPHSPRFQALKPMPPPTRPEQIQSRKGGAL
ncbi:hypothetical protein GETHOR_19170 [Geothrix oryzae]|uniref:Doubled CXXCH motif domain-containing protein n=1 Tax=Geothrix oryzae TaxID=2927975 RepID=A0ABN6UXZ4_9BACT|nr:cytochrome c3 family protein [Geothrix oryzae]BDU69816.1 hypothetical protein GETHOR_19170 [Geothrix oryzae]